MAGKERSPELRALSKRFAMLHGLSSSGACAWTGHRAGHVHILTMSIARSPIHHHIAMHAGNLVVFLAAVYQIYMLSAQHVSFGASSGGSVKAMLKG